MSLDTALSMMQTLIDCDEFQDIATLQVSFLTSYFAFKSHQTGEFSYILVIYFSLRILLFSQNVNELLGNRADLSDRLMQIGDSIVYKLVQWTKRLPFYAELPVEVSVILCYCVF